MSLYTQLGGRAAIRAALDHFYEKVLADPRVSPFFDDVDVEAVKRQQAAFFAMALGGPDDYRGRELGPAHARVRKAGLDQERFDVFMGHFRDTLHEFGVDGDLVEQVMDTAYQGKDAVLNG